MTPRPRVGVLSAEIILPALASAARKLHPRRMAHNPVMFTVEVGAVLTTGSQAFGITLGPDGALWYSEGAGRIGRFQPGGATPQEFTAPTAGALAGITLGPDGNLWFVENAANQIGRFTPGGTGTFAEFPIPTGGSNSIGIAAGPDGALWFAENHTNKIGRIATDGSIQEFTNGTLSGPNWITLGPDGNLWFTESGDRIGRITPAGVITEYPVTAGALPFGITAGPDGALWFTEYFGSSVGRVTTSGELTEYPAPGTPPTFASVIVTGPDGALWFSYSAGGAGPNQIGRFK